MSQSCPPAPASPAADRTPGGPAGVLRPAASPAWSAGLRSLGSPPEAPTPDLPRGAGGPLRRAAGSVRSRPAAAPAPPAVRPVAAVLDPDPLVRILSTAAVRDLGFAVADASDGEQCDAECETVFVALDARSGCPRLRPASPDRPRSAKALRTAPPWIPGRRVPVVGYTLAPEAVLAAHLAHGCVDVAVCLRAAGGRAVFVHARHEGEVASAGLSRREADVLLLLLQGVTTRGVAERLCVAPSTARSHCRAVLRKLGAGDRRALRARLLAGDLGGGLMTQAPA